MYFNIRRFDISHRQKDMQMRFANIFHYFYHFYLTDITDIYIFQKILFTTAGCIFYCFITIFYMTM